MTFEMIDPPKDVQEFNYGMDFRRLEPGQPKEQQHRLRLVINRDLATDSSYLRMDLECETAGHDHVKSTSTSMCDAYSIWDTYDPDEFFGRYDYSNSKDGEIVEARSGLILTWWEGYYDDAEIRWRYVEEVKSDD